MFQSQPVPLAPGPIDLIHANENDQKAHVTRLHAGMAKLLASKSDDYGPINSLMDIIGEATGYSAANIPAGEVLGFYRAMSKMLRYASLRAKGGEPNFEGLEETIRDLVGEAERLYGATMTNIDYQPTTETKE